MKLITTTALGLVAAVSAFPAAAQYNSAPPQLQPQVPANQQSANQPPAQAQRGGTPLPLPTTQTLTSLAL